MDLEPHLINKQSPEIDPLLLNKEKDQLSADDEDPYSFNSTSTSLIGLAIVFEVLLKQKYLNFFNWFGNSICNAWNTIVCCH